MAFGRSNSLTLNTGATNSLFASQNNNNNNNNNTLSQPQQSGGMFGSTQNNNNTSGGLSLFGGNKPQQTSTGGSSLFGGGSTQNQQQPQQSSGGLFGGGNNTTSNTQQSGGGGLFGSSTQQSSQPQQSGGLFGGSLFGGGQQNTQNQNQTQQQGQQQVGGGLFGGGGGGSSLFGGQQNQNNNQSQQQSQQQPTGGSLFGGGGGGNSLFGGTGNQQAPNTQQQKPAGSLFGGGGGFGASNPQPQNNSNTMNNSTFGSSLLNSQQPQQPQQTQSNQPSLLNASRYNHSQYVPFAGSLRINQNQSSTPQTANNNQSNPSNSVAGARISIQDLRPTTRFSDLTEPVQQELERIDAMIKTQENYAKQIQAILPSTGDAVGSLTPDLSLIAEKLEAVEEVLGRDAVEVRATAGVVEKDRKDFDRVERVVREVGLPETVRRQQRQQQGEGRGGYYGSLATEVGEPEYDTNLVGNYFSPLAKELGERLEGYGRGLEEIEGHLRTIEGTTVNQAQGLMQRRAAGVGAQEGKMGGDESVRELADTLRGFERSILSAAAMVGECRDGVNGLVLGERGGRY